jgi:thioredoxin-related protein
MQHGPCKFMMNQVFPKPEIYNYINEHFVAYKVDVDVDGESAAEHMVKGIPTLLFLDADEAGTELKRLVGSRPADKFLGELKSIIGE